MFLEHAHDTPLVESESFEAVYIAVELATVVSMLRAVVFDEHLELPVEKIASADERSVGSVDIAVEFGLGKATSHQEQSQLGLLRGPGARPHPLESMLQRADPAPASA